MTVIREIPDTVAFSTERLEIRKMTNDEWELFVENVVFANECLFTLAHEKDEKLGFRGGDFRIFDSGVAEQSFRYEIADVGKTA